MGVLSALVGVPYEAVVIGGKMVVLRAAGIIFLIIIGFPEVPWAMVCGTWCGGNFHEFHGSFNVVGGDQGRRFCVAVSVSAFLYEFQGVVEVLDRFPGVIRWLIAFPVVFVTGRGGAGRVFNL